MITEKDIQPGAKFISNRPFFEDKPIVILEVRDHIVSFKYGELELVRPVRYLVGHLRTNYNSEPKPLDKAFKTLDKIYCQHKNIVKDTWFNSRVYKHCKDCGAAIE